MENIYSIIIAFLFVFISELGDKTQLLVMTFSAKQKIATILLGVALGSLCSHGIAILFGSYLGSINNSEIKLVLDLITNILFIFFGIIFLFCKNKETKGGESNNILRKIGNKSIHYIILIAASIAIGEIGDKTFLASIGLGIKYSSYKIALVIGAILGMVTSDFIAIIVGKILRKNLPEDIMTKISGILFIMFGIIGLIC